MVNVIIRDLDQTRIHFEAAIQRVGQKEANRALRQQTGAKAALINRETRSFRSTFSNLVYTIEARGDHLGLPHFSPRQFRYGVRAKPWGRFQRFEGAFLIGSLSNNAFVRTTAARFPIKKMFGPAIPKEMLQHETKRAFVETQPDVLAEAIRQLQRIIEGA